MNAMYIAIQVTKPGEFATVMKQLVDPGPGQVRIRVEACSVIGFAQQTFGMTAND